MPGYSLALEQLTILPQGSSLARPSLTICRRGNPLTRSPRFYAGTAITISPRGKPCLAARENVTYLRTFEVRENSSNAAKGEDQIDFEEGSGHTSCLGRQRCLPNGRSWSAGISDDF